jgi:membrane fusion protein (multidrug efflux system)
MARSTLRPPVLAAALLALVIGVLLGGGVAFLLLAPGSSGGAAGEGPGGGPGGGPGAGGGPGNGGDMMGGAPPALVRVGTASTEALQQRFEVVGRLQEVRRATIAAEVRGKVLDVPIEEGDRVEGGQAVLARIDGVWAEAALAAAVSRVASAEATLDQSQRDLEYLEALQSAGSARPREVADMRSQVRAHEASLAAAVAERDEAAVAVERLAVLAPFTGVVTRKLAEVGQWVEPGAAVAELISTDAIDAVVFVPERVINTVRLGERIEVLIEPLGEVVNGEVIAVIPSGSSAARTFPVKVRLDDHGGRLKPGMSAVARLPLGERSQVLTVPRDAVQFAGGAASVWAALPNGGAPMPIAMPLSVEVLFGSGDRFAVRPLPSMGGAELVPEMPVIIEGAEMLFPTRPLIVMDEPVAANR